MTSDDRPGEGQRVPTVRGLRRRRRAWEDSLSEDAGPRAQIPRRTPAGRTATPGMQPRRTPQDLHRPELLGDEPLRNLTPLRRRFITIGCIVVLLTLLGLFSHPVTLFPALVALVLAAGYLSFVWADSRAAMRVEGDRLVVRNVRRTREVNGTDVSRLTYQYNGRTPDFRLVLADGRKVWVPASRLDRGHTTLFAWLLVHAPQTMWDVRSQEYLAGLDAKGWI